MGQALTSRSLRPPLSVLLAVGPWRQLLYWASGEVGRGQDDCPRLEWRAEKLVRRVLLSPLTLEPCCLLELQRPTSRARFTCGYPDSLVLEKTPADCCPGIITAPKVPQSEQHSLTPGAAFPWSISQLMRRGSPGSWETMWGGGRRPRETQPS